MKKSIFILTLFFLFSFSIVQAGTLVKKVYFSTFPIVINGKEYSSESPILSYQNRTYVSLREFSEMIGVGIDFKNDTIIISTQENDATDSSNKNENKESDVADSSNENKDNDTNLLDVQVNLNNNNLSNEEGSLAYESNNVVYISKTGTKYHLLSKCNGGSYSAINLNDAIKKGYTPCKRCATIK